MRKLGVFDLETFFPQKDRIELALKLNALVASPSFAAWGEGEPLDPGALLRTPDGKPRAAIVYLAHLSDEERQFVVTLVLSKLVTWMRGQAGTSDLRTLVYMDEVFGFVPPTATPPAKKPILTVLKQGRAFGVGMVLSTQNPVDLDYKAMANAGTWMVGRLQTENDKARVLEGLESAAGGADLKAFDATIGGLQKRQFMLVRTKANQPVVFQTRWAMSYLRGPLTRDQISLLMKDRPRQAPPETSRRRWLRRPQSRNPRRFPWTAVRHLSLLRLRAAFPCSSSTLRPPGPVVSARCPADSGCAPIWRHGSVFASTTRRPQIDELQEYEALYGPLDSGLDLDSETAVDYDDRDFAAAAPAGAVYVLPAEPLGRGVVLP